MNKVEAKKLVIKFIVDGLRSAEIPGQITDNFDNEKDVLRVFDVCNDLAIELEKCYRLTERTNETQ